MLAAHSGMRWWSTKRLRTRHAQSGSSAMRTTGTCTGPSLDSIYGLAMQEHLTSKASKEHCLVTRVLHTCVTLKCCLVNVFSSPFLVQLLINIIRIWAQ